MGSEGLPNLPSQLFLDCYKSLEDKKEEIFGIFSVLALTLVIPLSLKP